MALTGACLVLFVTFHALMNGVALFWPSAYNEVCLFLGANWYALIASAGLAVLFILHIVYAVWLTVQNRSGLKGASWNANARKWEANIRVAGKRRYLGLHATAQEAHDAYAAAAVEYHGEFARCA